MPTILKTKNSVTTTVVPTTLQQGELAVNITDKKVWVGNAATTPVQLLGGGADGSFTNISVSGVATFGAGTVSLPSITTTGDTNTGIFFPAADTIAFTEGGVESMRIDSSGRLGIGTSSPSNRLSVVSSSNTVIRAETTGTDRVDVTLSKNSGSARDYAISVAGSANGYGIPDQFFSIIDISAGQPRLTINTSGDVGIGTTSPVSFGAGYTTLTVNNATTGGGVVLATGGTQKGALFNGGNAVYLDASNSAGTINFRNTSTGASTVINTTGVIALNGAVTNATGVGITFPATQSASSDANTLDDYEEGTWTPILGRFTTDPTITYSDRRGTYVKIGSMVYCMAFFTISSISANGSGLNQLAGFPFVPESVGSSRWVLNVGLNECLTTAISGYTVAGSTFGFFYNTTNQSNPNANYATGQMFISFSYQTT